MNIKKLSTLIQSKMLITLEFRKIGTKIINIDVLKMLITKDFETIEHLNIWVMH